MTEPRICDNQNAPAGYLIVRKTGNTMPLAGELVDIYQAMPAEPYIPERRAAEHAAHAAHQAELEQSLAAAHPALQPIIKLHSNNGHGDCNGCDGGPDYSGEWPCRTIELILEQDAEE